MKNDIIINIPDYEGIGVYSLTNNENGKIYIGSSINVKARILQHLYSFHSLNCNPKFIQDLHNNNTFSAQIIEKFSYGISEYELRNKEFFYIKKYDSLKNGYNCTPSSYLDPKLKHAYIMPPFLPISRSSSGLRSLFGIRFDFAILPPICCDVATLLPF